MNKDTKLEKRFSLIEEQFSAKDYHKALQLTEQFLIEAPLGMNKRLFGKVWVMKGRCLWAMKKYNESVKAYDRCRPYYEWLAKKTDPDKRSLRLCVELVIAEKLLFVTNRHELKKRLAWCEDYAEELLKDCPLAEWKGEMLPRIGYCIHVFFLIGLCYRESDPGKVHKALKRGLSLLKEAREINAPTDAWPSNFSCTRAYLHLILCDLRLGDLRNIEINLKHSIEEAQREEPYAEMHEMAVLVINAIYNYAADNEDQTILTTAIYGIDLWKPAYWSQKARADLLSLEARCLILEATYLREICSKEETVAMVDRALEVAVKSKDKKLVLEIHTMAADIFDSLDMRDYAMNHRKLGFDPQLDLMKKIILKINESDLMQKFSILKHLAEINDERLPRLLSVLIDGAIEIAEDKMVAGEPNIAELLLKKLIPDDELFYCNLASNELEMIELRHELNQTDPIWLANWDQAFSLLLKSLIAQNKIDEAFSISKKLEAIYSCGQHYRLDLANLYLLSGDIYEFYGKTESAWPHIHDIKAMGRYFYLHAQRFLKMEKHKEASCALALSLLWNSDDAVRAELLNLSQKKGFSQDPNELLLQAPKYLKGADIHLTINSYWIDTILNRAEANFQNPSLVFSDIFYMQNLPSFNLSEDRDARKAKIIDRFLGAGTLLFEQKKYEKSILYTLGFIDIFTHSLKEVSDKNLGDVMLSSLISAHNSLGLGYTYTGKYELACIYYSVAQELIDSFKKEGKFKGVTKLQADLFYNLACSHSIFNHLDESKKYALLFLEIEPNAELELFADEDMANLVSKEMLKGV